MGRHKLATLEANCTPRCQSTRHLDEVNAAIVTATSDHELLVYLSTQCWNVANGRDSRGRTALHVAASAGRLAAIDWLLEQGADPQLTDFENTWCALHRAVYYGQLNCARRLIAVTTLPLSRDREGWDPLELLVRDLGPLDWHADAASIGDVYTWGNNSNFGLGRSGGASSRSEPELVDFFARRCISISKVLLGQYHSVFVSSDGRCFVCGHGRGGRLGLNCENSAVEPAELRFGIKNRVVEAALGLDHTLLLMQDGQILSFGKNQFGQLGHGQAPTEFDVCAEPRPVRFRHVESQSLRGVSASCHHSVAWTDSALFCWGSNCGQLGLSREAGSQLARPIAVTSFTPARDMRIDRVLSCDTALLILLRIVEADADSSRHIPNWRTANTERERRLASMSSHLSEIYLCIDYGCRRLTFGSGAPRLSLLDAAICGGKSRGGEAVGKSLVKVAVITSEMELFLWQKGVFQRLVWCASGCNSLLPLAPVRAVLAADQLFFVTRWGEAYMCDLSQLRSRGGKVATQRQSSGSVKERQLQEAEQKRRSNLQPALCLMERELLWEAGVRRIAHVFRGVAVSSNPKGGAWAVVQASPATFLTETPETQEGSLPTSLVQLLQCSVFADLLLLIDDVALPAHRFVLAAASDFLLHLLTSPRAPRPQSMTSSHDSWLLVDYCESSCQWRLHFLDADPNAVKLLRSLFYHEALPTSIIDLKDLINSVRELALKLGCNEIVAHIRKLQRATANSRRIRLDPTALSPLADVFLKGEEEEVQGEAPFSIPCHRGLLAVRSAYFDSYFRFSTSQHVQCPSSFSMQLPYSTSAVRALVNFCYTDGLPDHLNSPRQVVDVDSVTAELCQLLQLADYLQMSDLRHLVEASLMEKVSLRNCALLIELARQSGAVLLRDLVLHWSRRNLMALLEARLLDELCCEALDELATLHRAHVRGMHRRTRCLAQVEAPQSLKWIGSADMSVVAPSTLALVDYRRVRLPRRRHLTTNSTCSSKDSNEPDHESVSLINEHLNKLDVNEEDFELRAPLELEFPLPSVVDAGELKHKLCNETSLSCGSVKEKKNSGCKKVSQRERKKLAQNLNKQWNAAPSEAKSPSSEKGSSAWGAAACRGLENNRCHSLREVMLAEQQQAAVAALKLTPSMSSAMRAQKVDKPRPTWKKVETTSPMGHIGSSRMADILIEQEQERQDLRTILNKPFELIQIEERALQELRQSECAGCFDDFKVTVSFVTATSCAARPIWKATANGRGT